MECDSEYEVCGDKEGRVLIKLGHRSEGTRERRIGREHMYEIS